MIPHSILRLSHPSEALFLLTLTFLFALLVRELYPVQKGQYRTHPSRPERTVVGSIGLSPAWYPSIATNSSNRTIPARPMRSQYIPYETNNRKTHCPSQREGQLLREVHAAEEGLEAGVGSSLIGRSRASGESVSARGLGVSRRFL